MLKCHISPFWWPKMLSYEVMGVLVWLLLQSINIVVLCLRVVNLSFLLGCDLGAQGPRHHRTPARATKTKAIRSWARDMKQVDRKQTFFLPAVPLSGAKVGYKIASVRSVSSENVSSFRRINSLCIWQNICDECFAWNSDDPNFGEMFQNWRYTVAKCSAQLSRAFFSPKFIAASLRRCRPSHVIAAMYGRCGFFPHSGRSRCNVCNADKYKQKCGGKIAIFFFECINIWLQTMLLAHKCGDKEELRRKRQSSNHPNILQSKLKHHAWSRSDFDAMILLDEIWCSLTNHHGRCTCVTGHNSRHSGQTNEI